MDTLILENFRCFAGRHEVPLRPLTLLVGENSTGKTSLLAGTRAVLELRNAIQTPDFNQEPFHLGSFVEIVNNRVGTRRPAAFKLGFMSSVNVLEGEFRDRNAQPVLTNWLISSDNGLRISAKLSENSWNISGYDADGGFNGGIVLATPIFFTSILFSDYYLEMLCNYDALDKNRRDNWNEIVHELDLASTVLPFACSPVRAKPERTYDVTSDETKPQGYHVPVTLSQIFGRDEWDRIKSPLLGFARAAGLFDKITVNKLRNGEGGPFQLEVSLEGQRRNIIDVGYGVSQVLPVVFDAVRGARNRLFMFQQPEIHLHPRAQAELATLFGSLVKTQKKQFLIETHSDNLIDRVRMDVRDKKNISPDDVVILYFEKQKNGVKIYPIHLDEMGHLIDAPTTYRSFFLAEERRYWGVD